MMCHHGGTLFDLCEHCVNAVNVTMDLLCANTELPHSKEALLSLVFLIISFQLIQTWKILKIFHSFLLFANYAVVASVYPTQINPYNDMFISRTDEGHNALSVSPIASQNGRS